MVAVVGCMGASRLRRSVWRYAYTNADANTNSDANSNAGAGGKQSADGQYHCKSDFGSCSAVSRISVER